MTHKIHHSHGHGVHKRTGTFSKIFRWHLDPPGGPMPVRVEVVGSFNDWKPALLKRDRVSGVWQAALHDIPGNRTHTYMLLVNGRPVTDKHSDGLAIPHTEEEKKYQLATPRGPRVFMLASQAK